MATLNVPRKVRASGEIRVKETMAMVRYKIHNAHMAKRDHITVTEANGKPLDLKHSLINSISD